MTIREQLRAAWFDEQPAWVREAYHNVGWFHRVVDACIDWGDNATLWREVAHLGLLQAQHHEERARKLDAIAPRKVRCPDGTVLICHCPDELVPDPDEPPTGSPL